jgi:hypothetical protein
MPSEMLDIQEHNRAARLSAHKFIECKYRARNYICIHMRFKYRDITKLYPYNSTTWARQHHNQAEPLPSPTAKQETFSQKER